MQLAGSLSPSSWFGNVQSCDVSLSSVNAMSCNSSTRSQYHFMDNNVDYKQTISDHTKKT